MSEPRLIQVIRRLADLEAQGDLTASELAELNALRGELTARWPEVSNALATAYMSEGHIHE